jgi:hypothetical protein
VRKPYNSHVCSLNILKAYQAIAGHLQRFPEDEDRFPNFCPKVKPILAKGSAGPLEGDLYSAQYFHGRWSTFITNLTLLLTSLQGMV